MKKKTVKKQTTENHVRAGLIDSINGEDYPKDIDNIEPSGIMKKFYTAGGFVVMSFFIMALLVSAQNSGGLWFEGMLAVFLTYLVFTKEDRN